MSKEKTNEDGKRGLLTKISFGVFLVSLLSLLARCIYSVRFALVKGLSDSYLCIVNAPLSDKITMVLGTTAIISFFVFLASVGGDVDNIVENKND